MKTTQPQRTDRCAFLVTLLLGFGVVNSNAQFSSGSTGADGPLNVTSGTNVLALPTNGIFNFTTITVASNATLKFTTNGLNTPVYLLATGDVVVNGTIDVSGGNGNANFGGVGGPGGFAGGNPGISGSPAGDGHGPGGGRAGTSSAVSSTNHAGHAAYGSAAWHGSGGAPLTAGNGPVYGSPLLVPLVGGSGGGGRPGLGGRGGGGGILVASSTSIGVGGQILAHGGVYDSSNGFFDNVGSGSGGAIRLVSPTVSGNGTLVAFGMVPGNLQPDEGWGGSGRIRIDCLDRRSLAFTYSFSPQSPGSVSIGSFMMTFLSKPPHLDITQVGTNNIPVGTSTPVFFFLPQNSSTNQTVTVQANNFGGQVPIRVVLTPDNGPSSSYDAQIDNSTVNPASVTVPVVVPVNVIVHVNAWTR